MVNGKSEGDQERLHHNILVNALEALLSAAEAVRRDEGPRSIKEAVLHLANGLELIIKARLALEHWALLFANVDQATFSKLTEADFTSVDFGRAVDRLQQIVGVSIERSVKSHIDDLRKLRNRLTHLTASLDAAQTKSLIAKSMTFCVTFCEDQGMLTPETEELLSDTHLNLTELKEFVDDRMQSVLEGWKDALIWECPECWQEALVIDGGIADCKFCRRTTDPRDLASRHAESPIEDCPECDTEGSFAFVLYNNESGEWICFSCGVHSENYHHCMRCEQMAYFDEVEDVKFCTNCWDHIMSRR